MLYGDEREIHCDRKFPLNGQWYRILFFETDDKKFVFAKVYRQDVKKQDTEKEDAENWNFVCELDPHQIFWEPTTIEERIRILKDAMNGKGVPPTEWSESLCGLSLEDALRVVCKLEPAGPFKIEVRTDDKKGIDETTIFRR